MCSRPELWLTLCTTVEQQTTCAGTLSTLDGKRNSFEVKMIIYVCVALEGVKRLLLEVALIAWLLDCRQEVT